MNLSMEQKESIDEGSLEFSQNIQFDQDSFKIEENSKWTEF